MSLEAFRLVLEAVILLLLLYLAFLKSYFQEKGKNLATKEDIRDITSLVESVRSRLEYSLQAKLSLRAEEHEALVDYFSKYSAWLSAISYCSFAGINKDNAARLGEIRSQLDSHHVAVDLAAGKMRLFVEDEEINSQCANLMAETLKFQAHVQRASFKFERVHLEARQMELTTPPQQQLEPYKALLVKEENLYKELKEEQLQLFRELHPLVQRHRRAISAHIRGLVNG